MPKIRDLGISFIPGGLPGCIEDAKKTGCTTTKDCKPSKKGGKYAGGLTPEEIAQLRQQLQAYV
jgi:hypothetical protein